MGIILLFLSSEILSYKNSCILENQSCRQCYT